MKKIVLTLWIFWLLFCWVSFATDSTKIFDWCGPMSNYKNEKWYNKLSNLLLKQEVVTTKDEFYTDNKSTSLVQEICYSKFLNKVIVNVPYIDIKIKKCINEQWMTWDSCIKILNIFAYDIKNNKLSKATLDKNTIDDSFSKISQKNKYKIRSFNNVFDSYQNSNSTMWLINWFWKRKWNYIEMFSSEWWLCTINHKRR